MDTLAEASHNPGTGSSGKRAIPLAATVARALGVVPSWPNLQTIRIAIESEADYFGSTREEIAEMIVRAGTERSCASLYVCPSEWEKREIYRENAVDRFWFEDARWRSKFAYQEFLERRRAKRQSEPEKIA